MKWRNDEFGINWEYFLHRDYDHEHEHDCGNGHKHQAFRKARLPACRLTRTTIFFALGCLSTEVIIAIAVGGSVAVVVVGGVGFAFGFFINKRCVRVYMSYATARLQVIPAISFNCAL